MSLIWSDGVVRENSREAADPSNNQPRIYEWSGWSQYIKIEIKILSSIWILEKIIEKFENFGSVKE